MREARLTACEFLRSTDESVRADASVKASDALCEYVKTMVNEFDEKFGECMKDFQKSGDTPASPATTQASGASGGFHGAGAAFSDAFDHCYAKYRTDYESTFNWYKMAVEGGCNIMSRYL